MSYYVTDEYLLMQQSVHCREGVVACGIVAEGGYNNGPSTQRLAFRLLHKIFEPTPVHPYSFTSYSVVC